MTGNPAFLAGVHNYFILRLVEIKDRAAPNSLADVYSIATLGILGSVNAAVRFAAGDRSRHLRAALHVGNWWPSRAVSNTLFTYKHLGARNGCSVIWFQPMWP